MQNETQNQDTNTAQVANEEAPAQTEASQDQNTSAQEAAPQQEATNNAQPATSEVVHDNPGNIPEGVTYDPTMVPDEEFDPKFVPEGAYDPRSNPDLSLDDGVFPDGEPYVPEGGYVPDFVPEDDPSSPGVEPVSEEGLNPADDMTDLAVTMSSEDLVGSDRNATMYPEDLEGSDPEMGTDPKVTMSPEDLFGSEFDDMGFFSDDEAQRILEDEKADSVPDSDGSIWDSFSPISDGAIDYDYAVFGDESDKGSADVTSEQEEASEAQSEAQSNFTDAEYQEVLDDLDHGNIEDVREFLEDLAHGGNDYTEEAPQYAPGDPDEDSGKLVEEGISIEDIVGGEENNVQQDFEDGNNNSTEEYIYDEEAYEDAEDALKDLQHALKHGDEEEHAKALEKLQGYLGGFDKGANEDQDRTETQDEQIPSVSEENSGGDGMEDLFDLSDADGNGISDWEELDSDGNGIDDFEEIADNDDFIIECF